MNISDSSQLAPLDSPHVVPADSSGASRLSRRSLLIGGGVVAAAGASGGIALSRRNSGSDMPSVSDRVEFFGRHQAGIVTPAQDRLHFAAFDLTTTRREDVVKLLQRWTTAAARLTVGATVGQFGAVDGPASAPPDDTGEALDLPPSRLTITVGFGRSMFTGPDGADRFGLASHLPAGLVELPHFPGDRLDPRRSDGDLCVQACADDPQVAVHAVRNFARLAFGVASVRWSQLGFGRTSSTSTTQQTPRNLFGFKDGTSNLKAEDTEAIDRHVWVAEADGNPWLTDGSFLIARRINMRIETWDRESLAGQETIVGRQKGSGSPLSGGHEFTPPDFGLAGRNNEPIIAPDSHVRLAHPSNNDGHSILRRGYNFTDGSDGLGRLDAGLFFIAYVRDPRVQYIPLQNKLSKDDAMSEYLQHTGSALFAVAPGVARSGGYLGESLFSS